MKTSSLVLPVAALITVLGATGALAQKTPPKTASAQGAQKQTTQAQAPTSVSDFLSSWSRLLPGKDQYETAAQYRSRADAFIDQNSEKSNRIQVRRAFRNDRQFDYDAEQQVAKFDFEEIGDFSKDVSDGRSNATNSFCKITRERNNKLVFLPAPNLSLTYPYSQQLETKDGYPTVRFSLKIPGNEARNLDGNLVFVFTFRMRDIPDTRTDDRADCSNYREPTHVTQTTTKSEPWLDNLKVIDSRSGALVAELAARR